MYGVVVIKKLEPLAILILEDFNGGIRGMLAGNDFESTVLARNYQDFEADCGSKAKE